AEFPSALGSARCAIEIQRAIAQENEALDAERRMLFRIGIHVGDVIVEDGRIYGDGVNIAARLESLADPGGICISEAVYREVRGKLENFHVEELGVRELKNIEHPIRLYKVPPLRPAEVEKSEGNVPAPREVAPTGSWLRDVTHPMTLVPTVVAAFLIASEALLFPSAGALPAVGTILLAVVAGRVLEKRAPGSFLLALGAALAAGAAWTGWSRVTDLLFVLAGGIVAALGVGRAARKR
ncbi:MAG: adenylate/guanylate cyclase domain-containing protein, partial [Candidatus Binatia bacterium]